MPQIIPLKTPLLNTNEDHVMVASLEVNEGQVVARGNLLAVFETTKSSAEFLAESDGRIVGLLVKAGDILPVGQIWAYLADPDEKVDLFQLPESLKSGSNNAVPTQDQTGRFTRAAQALAAKNNLSATDFPGEGIITEKMINEFIQRRDKKTGLHWWVEKPANDSKKVLIFGAGGHGRSLAELIRLLPQYTLHGFTDDGVGLPETVLGMQLYGGKDVLENLFNEGICLAANGVGGIGNINQRVEVFHALRDAGFFCPALIHPFAFIEASAKLADGIQVFPFAYVGSQVSVGYGCIINTGAIISHDCILGDMVNLSPGATLAGGVEIGELALIGMRATVNLGVKIGAHARIGNGATVKADVPENGVVPAGAVWPLR